MCAVRPKQGSAKSAQASDHEAELSKVRCLCGKWWAYRSSDTIVLRCKLCRRDVVITGEDLRIEYR